MEPSPAVDRGVLFDPSSVARSSGTPLARQLKRNVMATMRHLIIIMIAVLCGCADKRNPSATPPAATQPSAATRPAELAKTEFAMLPGQAITATTPVGTIEIRADDWLK